MRGNRLRVQERMTDRHQDWDSFVSTLVNITLLREMEGVPFYTVFLTPNLSSRLYGTIFVPSVCNSREGFC